MSIKKIFAVCLVFILVLPCVTGCTGTDVVTGNHTQQDSASSPNTGGTGMNIKVHRAGSGGRDTAYVQGVCAQKRFEVTENNNLLAIPISAVPVNVMLYVPVIVDAWEYRLMLYRDEANEIHVSINLCEQCIASGSGGHVQWSYNLSSKYIICGSCGSIYNLSVVGDKNAMAIDSCVPYALTEEDYYVVKISDVIIDLEAYPWMSDAVLDPGSYGVPAASISLYKDREAVVITYETLAKANEVFNEWLKKGLEAIGDSVEQVSGEQAADTEPAVPPTDAEQNLTEGAESTEQENTNPTE